MSINLINEITALVDEIPKQCDLMAGMNTNHHTQDIGGGVTIGVNIRLRGEAEHWRSLSARNVDEMIQLRDDLATFIAEHRLGARPITTSPGASIGSDEDALPPIWALEAMNEEVIN